MSQISARKVIDTKSSVTHLSGTVHAQGSPLFHDEASRLRSLASSPTVAIRFTKHAREECAKDRVFEIDVLNMLTRCRVTLVEGSGLNETWRAEGVDSDNRKLTAVVSVFERADLIRVITCWAGGVRR